MEVIIYFPNSGRRNAIGPKSEAQNLNRMGIKQTALHYYQPVSISTFNMNL